jgi:carboxymethylenebutenolidase
MEPKEMERLWSSHLEAEFATKDVEAALATMTEDAYVNHVPHNSGGRGRDQVRAFYRDVFIPSWPDDVQVQQVNRVVGDEQLVDESHVTFTHTRKMDWFLPGVPPTNRKVEVDVVVVVQFRHDRIACERIYWDQATVLRQVGLL